MEVVYIEFDNLVFKFNYFRLFVVLILNKKDKKYYKNIYKKKCLFRLNYVNRKVNKVYK